MSQDMYDDRTEDMLIGAEEGAVADETKEDKFIRIVNYRTRKTIERLRLLKNCANKGTYSYTQDQVDRMLDVLAKELEDLSSVFAAQEANDEIEDIL